MLRVVQSHVVEFPCVVAVVCTSIWRKNDSAGPIVKEIPFTAATMCSKSR